MRKEIETQNKTPEIPTRTLSIIKSQAKGSFTHRDFKIDGINYVLVPCPKFNPDHSINGEPAEFHYQDNGECAIYIWKELNTNVKKVLLFHEITETFFRFKFAIQNPQAHNLTLQHEVTFKKEINLSEEDQKTLAELRV